MPKPNPSGPRRRLVDAAVALPLIGAILVFVPLLWPQSIHRGAIQSGAIQGGPKQGVDVVQTSDAIVYLFLIWAVMIVGALILAFALRKTDTPDD